MKKTLEFLSLLSFLVFFYSACNSKNNKPETENLTVDSLLTLVQYRTFQYFWDGAEPVSGMARERIHMDRIYPDNDMNVVTSGGTGFGVMAILAGIERGFITRNEGFERLKKIAGFLTKADRFHGAWPHWINGETGKVKPFSKKDNGADLVETAYLIQGLLSVREYFNDGNESERKLAADIDQLWKEVEWNWFTREGENGALEYGGPLFWAHYSYLGLDPRKLKDRYADSWQENMNQTLINWKWCTENPDHYAGYSSDCWGLTASYSIKFYAAHAPGEKNDLGEKIWGDYGFYDAFSVQENWYPQKYLAIDQGPVVVMIENYRSGLLWDLFMAAPEIKDGLVKLNFTTDKN